MSERRIGIPDDSLLRRAEMLGYRLEDYVYERASIVIDWVVGYDADRIDAESKTT